MGTTIATDAWRCLVDAGILHRAGVQFLHLRSANLSTADQPTRSPGVMRMSAYVIAAVLSAGLPTAARAQSAPPAAVPPTSPAPTAGETQSHWTITGFVGSNFGNSTLDPSVAFGGQFAFLW